MSLQTLPEPPFFPSIQLPLMPMASKPAVPARLERQAGMLDGAGRSICGAELPRACAQRRLWPFATCGVESPSYCDGRGSAWAPLASPENTHIGGRAFCIPILVERLTTDPLSPAPSPAPCAPLDTAPSDGTKKGVIAYRKHQSASETRRGATAESKPKVLDDIIEPASAPRPRRQNTALKLKMRRPHRSAPERKRRATTTRRTGRPARGKSATRRR